MRRIALVFVALLFASGCVSKPFDVKVLPRVEPERIGAPVASGPLVVRAEAIWDEMWLLEQFDANLILAGVLPVRVDLENVGGEAISTKRIDFEGVDGSGREFEHLDAKKARERIEDYYGVTIRSEVGNELYKEDFAANALDTKRELAPGERRQGFVFLEIPRGVNGRVPVRLDVRSKRAGVRATLQL